jgi:plastocyanin
MRLKLLLVPLVALAGLLGVSSFVGASAVPQTRIILVGGGGSGVAANDFFPDEITINKGDTITFTNPYEEMHTVTFVPQLPDPLPVPDLIIANPSGPGQIFNPLAFNATNAAGAVTDLDPHTYFNSGFLAKGDSTDVSFNVAGSYTFLCLFHPGMEINVDVAPQPVTIDSQDDIDALGVTQRDRFIGAGTAIAAAATLNRVTDSSGASTWGLAVGATRGQTDVMQFLPSAPLNISTGDTVKWTSSTQTPHTVTFGTPVNPIAAIGGYTGISAAAALPNGGPTYSGGDANSGLLDSTGQLPGGSSYSLTFTKPGTYTYLCLLHSDQGMAGTIVVSDKSVAPANPSPQPITAPNTGTGGAAGARGSWLPALLILGIAGVAFVVAGTRAAVRSKA